MAQVRTAAPSWIHQRACPRCGYTGWELQQAADQLPFECPCCAEDLYARRPLTYAEREALLDPCSAAILVPPPPARPIRPIARFFRGLVALVRWPFRL